VILLKTMSLSIFDEDFMEIIEIWFIFLHFQLLKTNQSIVLK